MKTIWKGSLSFGLVSIPIELFSAVQQHAFGFTLLHETCHTPLNYYRWCEHCQKDVEWQHTVKGIKLADGTYFTMTQAQLKDLKPKKSDQLTLIACIDEDTVEPLYFDQHYYVLPVKPQEKSFHLLLAVLKKKKKELVVRAIFREKEYICLLKPYQDILVLTTLNYSYEIKTVPQVEHAEPSLPPKELALAEQLLMTWYTKKFSLTKFKDTFAEQLMQTIEQERKGKKRKRASAPKKKKALTPASSSLTKALKESLLIQDKGQTKLAKRAR